jgi:lipopolysaccharide export system permease protein
MTILDRYLVKKFIFNLLFGIFAFVIVFLVIDLVENIDKFIDLKVKFITILIYYLYYIPYIISLTLPMSMLLACLFALGSMSQHNEIIAQKSAGISLYRITLPLLVLALLISVLSGFFNELVVPVTNQARFDIYRYDIKNNPRSIGTRRTNIDIQDLKNRKVSIAYYNGSTKEALTVSIQYFNGPLLVQRLDAKKMIWQDSSWVLQDIVERTITDTVENLISYPQRVMKDLNFKPESLLEVQKNPEEMSYKELKIFIAEMDRIGAEIRKWVVELYLKISYPFSNFIIILFGAPIAAQKRRSGTAVGIGISLMVCFVYFIIMRTGQVLGYQDTLVPWLAAWIGNIIFGLAGIVIMIKVRK